MNPQHLTDLGRAAAAGAVILGRLHLRRRGGAYRLFAGAAAVTVDLPGDIAARTACELCGVVPDPDLVGDVIASAITEG